MSSTSASWTSFIKSLASYNGDLSSLTAPPFILSPTSLVEYSQYWSEHVDLFLAPNFIQQEPNDIDSVELKHMVAVLRWFISTLKSQYCSRAETLGGEKKPLNPFLGELFVGKWTDESPSKKFGETLLVSEQVSHHPPITAYAIQNKTNKTTLQGYNGVRASMSATALNVRQYGHALLSYENLNEKYLITLPPLHIEGILMAAPFVELEQKSYIQSSAGYVAVIEYSGKGYFSGKSNSFKARIYKNISEAEDKTKALYTVSGQWSGVSSISRGNTVASDAQVFFDAKNSKPQHLTVKPIEEQSPLESRRAWQKVAEAIRANNYNLIHEEKTKIENEQRELRKKEAADDTPWKQKFFEEIDYTTLTEEDDETGYVKLANMANLSLKNVPSGTRKGSSKDNETEAGSHWRFCPERLDTTDIVF
ncbi:Protein KES1 [Ogataea parapolymorpha DL-1]|uniref:Protein KES1 n=1 Tax=Ogataea parapolymorpha (strain ATCC 26012 / BCRC 20466 / JCM 22074 / NRRL Y-7560 / DL-1) TaxID=871575 RepID=W1Q8A3_OGAPD|nr:Protein KES1 [Ogataea parapolymorpha DL-1]ESW97001.1 Protein KES1 [Ogataea parapolymorpha DL-1]